MTVAMNPWPDDDVILYDGVCVFCSRWIRFIAARDGDKRFRFTAIQSGYGTRLARALRKSDAALTVLSNLPGWRWARMLRLFPKPLRDVVYNLVARNRYRIFGKNDACFVPDAKLRARVIE